MNKKLSFVICLLGLSLYSYSQSPQSEINLESGTIIIPEIQGMGNAFVSNPSSWNSLFTNPAGFSTETPKFGVDITSWIYMNQSIDSYMVIINSNDTYQTIMNLFETNNGTGGGFSASIGIVGGNIAIASYATLDSFLSEKIDTNINGTIDTEIGLILGLSVPFDFFGIPFIIGGALRPYNRIHGYLDSEDVVAITTSSLIDVINGNTVLDIPVNYCSLKVSLDLGFLVKLNEFNFGASIRNISTPALYSETTYKQVRASAFSIAENEKEFWYYPDITVGASYHPNLNSLIWLFDPEFHIDFTNFDLFFVHNQFSLSMVNIGIKTKILSFLILETGLHDGYVSLGCGIDLNILKCNIAFFTKEASSNSLQKPVSGVSANIRLRF